MEAGKSPLECIYVTEFVTAGVRFSGVMKATPETFVVREVDEEGRVADTRSTELPPDPPLSSCKSDSPSGPVKPEAADGGACDEVAPLTPEQVTGLEALHCRVMAAIQAGSFQFADTERFSLPQPADRAGRGRVHRAVRRRFPFLLTRNGQEGEGGPHILCLPDTHAASALLPLLDGFEQLKALQAFIARAPEDPRAKESVEVGPVVDKERRRALHHGIVQVNRSLETTTVSRGGESFVCVSWRRRKDKGLKRKRGQDDGEQGPQLLRFVLRKENVEHYEAIVRLAEVLKLQPSAFQFAGTKDKRAITYQYMTVRGVRPSALQAANATLGKHGLSVSGFEHVGRPLRLGQSQGNAFAIVLRGLRLGSQGSGEGGLRGAVEGNMRELASKGSVNYLGTQRVGAPGPAFDFAQCVVGRALLRADFEEVVRLMLAPRPGEAEAARGVKQGFIAGEDLPSLLKRVPRSMARERLLLQGLNRYGRGEVLKAVRCLSHSWLSMCIHAYQGWVWNRMASERIRQHGFRPVAGDLVIFDLHREGEEDAKDPPRVLTAEDVEGVGDFHELLYKVVLPMPGHAIAYPQTEIGELYGRMLEQDRAEGLLRPRQDKSLKEFQAKGAYRRLMMKPRGLEWEVVKGAEGAEPELHVRFRLPPGSFATVLLREASKDDGILLAQEQLLSGQGDAGGLNES